MCNFSSISFHFYEVLLSIHVLVNVLTFFLNIMFELKWTPIRVSQVEVVCNIIGDLDAEIAQHLQFINC